MEYDKTIATKIELLEMMNPGMNKSEIIDYYFTEISEQSHIKNPEHLKKIYAGGLQ